MNNRLDESTKIEKIKNVMMNGDWTITEMAVFIYLVDSELTQSMIAEKTRIPLNSLKRCVPQMKEKGLLIETRVEGRNIFLTSNLDYENPPEQDQSGRRENLRPVQPREQNQDDTKAQI